MIAVTDPNPDKWVLVTANRRFLTAWHEPADGAVAEDGDRATPGCQCANGSASFVWSRLRDVPASAEKCGHCAGRETPRAPGERLDAKLRRMDPEDLGLGPYPPEEGEA